MSYKLTILFILIGITHHFLGHKITTNITRQLNISKASPQKT